MGNIINEMQAKITEYQNLATMDAGDIDNAKKIRDGKEKLGAEIETLFASQTPLKWVNRVIMWCADGMPSFSKGCDGADANEVVKKALSANSEIDATNEQRSNLLKKYKK